VSIGTGQQAGRAVTDEAYMFPPGSALPQITRELALLLGGGRALLLQLAHPLIAAGVADHSRFQDAPQARLERTLDLMLTLPLGTWGAGRPVLRRFHAVHGPIVQGRSTALH